MEDMGRRMGAIETAEKPEAAQPPPQELDEQAEVQETAGAAREHDSVIPSVRDLRRDYRLGREVSRRLAELDFDEDFTDPPRNASARVRGKRSGAARTVQDKVLRDVDWPHFHIYTPRGKNLRHLKNFQSRSSYSATYKW